MTQNNLEEKSSKKQSPTGNNASSKAKNKKPEKPKIPSYLLDWARAQLNEEEIHMAQLLADFIEKNTKGSSPLLEKVKDFEVEDFSFVKYNLFCKGYIANHDSCVNLFVILLARIKEWTYPIDKNRQFHLKDAFFPEVQTYMKEDGLDLTSPLPNNAQFPVYIPEKVFQMLLCHLWVERQIKDFNNDVERQTRMEAARKIFLKGNKNMFGKCLDKFIWLLQHYSPESKKNSIPYPQWWHNGPWQFLAKANKVRNIFSHGDDVNVDNRGTIFAIYLYAIFAVAACEMVLEAETKERITLVSPDCNGEVLFRYEDEGQQIQQIKAGVSRNELVVYDLKEAGTYTFIAEQTVGKKSTQAKEIKTIERGQWLNDIICIYLKFNKDEPVPDGPEKTPSPDPAEDTTQDMPSTQDGGKTENVIEVAGTQEEGEDNVKNEHKDESNSGRSKEAEGKSNDTSSKIEALKEWCLTHKRWGIVAAGVLAILLIGTIAFKAITTSEPDKRPEVVVNGGTYPPLDGKTWIVREKNGGKIPSGKGKAEIQSMNYEATDYSMIVMTEMGPEEYHFSYNRQEGTLSSPELGEGHVEKGHGIYKLKIVFEGWILEIM